MTTELQPTLDQSRAGDSQALSQLIERFLPFARLVIRSMSRQRGTGLPAIDVMSVAAAAELSRFQGATEEEFLGWLRLVALKAAGYSVREPSSTGTRTTRHVQTARVAKAISQLPDDMALVVLSRHVDRLSFEELARVMKRGEAAVRALYVQALRSIRNHATQG